MTRYPQAMINVRVSHEGKLKFYMDARGQAPPLKPARRELGHDGRVVVRVSGTEPLIRVMTEGLDAEKIRAVAENIAEVVRRQLAE